MNREYVPRMRHLVIFSVLFGCGGNATTPLKPTADPITTATATGDATATASATATAAPTATQTATPTATPTAVATATASASATASAAPAGPAPLEGANINIGAFAADGLSLKDISCKSDGGGLGGLLGSMTVAAGLSKRKAALDKCGKGETRAHIWQKGGKVTKAEVVGDSKSGPCVQKALVGAPATMDSECLLTVVHGQ